MLEVKEIDNELVVNRCKVKLKLFNNPKVTNGFLFILAIFYKEKFSEYQKYRIQILSNFAN